MAKNRLVNEGYFNFQLIGVVSTAKEYKVAWALNEKLNWELKKADELKIEFSKNAIIRVSNFIDKTEHQEFMLIKNRIVSRSNNAFQFLLDELKQFDYLIKLRDETDQTDIKEVLSLVKSVEVIEYAANLEPDLIKSRDNLIF